MMTIVVEVLQTSSVGLGLLLLIVPFFKKPALSRVAARGTANGVSTISAPAEVLHDGR